MCGRCCIMAGRDIQVGCERSTYTEPQVVLSTCLTAVVACSNKNQPQESILPLRLNNPLHAVPCACPRFHAKGV